jgi:hypothetical protein
VHHRGTDNYWRIDIYTWDMLKDYSGALYHRCFFYVTDESIDDYTSCGFFILTLQWWGGSHAYEGNLNPGHHLGLLIASNAEGNDPKREIDQIYTAEFVDIYVEG